MEDFVFYCPTRIIFGRDSENRVGQEVKNICRKVLFVYGKESIKKSGLYDRVKESLEKEGVDYIELPGVMANPRLELARKGIEYCRKYDLGFILAVGGGSVIDTAKAISIGVPYSGDVWDFYAGKTTAASSVPVGAILTIPAAGSEASPGSVIFNEKLRKKAGIGCEITRPVFAILNPELAFTLSNYQKACGCCDIIAHILERYFSPTENAELTDRLCEAALKTVINNSRTMIQNPSDYNSHAEIMWSGTIAHNDLLGTGRIGDWSSHIIETEIGGFYDTAHGAGLAVIIPAWMRYVYKKRISKFLQYCSRVWEIKDNAKNNEGLALAGIEKTEKFFKDLGMPSRLNELGVSKVRFNEIAKRCTESGSLGNYVKLSYDDVLNILESAW